MGTENGAASRFAVLSLRACSRQRPRQRLKRRRPADPEASPRLRYFRLKIGPGRGFGRSRACQHGDVVRNADRQRSCMQDMWASSTANATLRGTAPLHQLLDCSSWFVSFVSVRSACWAPRAARQACDTKQNWEEPAVAHQCGSHCCWCCQVRVDEEADEKVRRKFLGAEAKPRPGSRGKVYEMPERVRAPSSNSRYRLVIASPVLHPPHGVRVCRASSTELRR